MTTADSTSAAASWNGFLYQGKVALYVVIRMMLDDNNSSTFKLRLEHLEDFVVFDSSDNVVSLHQVKATVSTNRSGYTGALSKVLKVNSNACTKRYFHVSSELNDFRDHSEDGLLITFYKNHEGKQFISLDNIESYIRAMIDDFVTPISPELTSFKYNRLLSLIDSKVNYIHAENQQSSANQLEASEQNPILFQEIKEILESEYPNDEMYNLECFRRNFINILDRFANSRVDKGDCVNDLNTCKRNISSLDNEPLQQLYFSLDPSETIKNISSNNDLDSYMDILCHLKNLRTNEYELPHYISNSTKSFLPTGIRLNQSTEDFRLNNIRQNIESPQSNHQLRKLFFEYNNFIVGMPEEGERSIPIDRKCTHDSTLNDQEFPSQAGSQCIQNNRLGKPKLVRFVSTGFAEEKLGEE